MANHPAPSNLTYSALTSQYLGYSYDCRAVGHAANNGILKQIKEVDAINKTDVCLVMWSFIERHAEMFNSNRGFSTLDYDLDKWWYRDLDQTEIVMFNRTLDSILAAQAILDNTGCEYVFLSNNLILQNYIKDLTKWINKDRWLFFPSDYIMFKRLGHPSKETQFDIFGRTKDKLTIQDLK